MSRWWRDVRSICGDPLGVQASMTSELNPNSNVGPKAHSNLDSRLKKAGSSCLFQLSFGPYVRHFRLCRSKSSQPGGS